MMIFDIKKGEEEESQKQINELIWDQSGITFNN
jgi:hypothetical protein